MYCTSADEMNRRTFLSEYVQRIFAASKAAPNVNGRWPICDDLTINLEVIDPILSSSQCDFTTGCCDQFTETVERLAASGLFDSCKSILHDRDALPEAYVQYLQWTCNKPVFGFAIRLLRSENEIHNLLSILLLTSTLERSFVDLFRTRCTKVPMLLRDLLCTSELEFLCGQQHMQLCRILMGPVTSINVRNIAWHGFAAPGELDVRYGYTLIVLAASIGQQLSRAGISDVIRREFKPVRTLTFRFDCSCAEGDKQDEKVKFIAKESVQRAFESSRRIPQCMRAIWQAAFAFAFDRCDPAFDVEAARDGCTRYACALALLLPAMEHVLRLRFCLTNGCADCMLTAVTSTLYTILEDILATQLDERYRELTNSRASLTNRLWTDLGDSRMQLLLDLFVFPDGCRLRDRLSHGDIDLTTVDLQLLSHVFCVAASVCLESECDLQQHVSTYESIYHPLSLTKQNYEAIASSLCQLENLRASECGSASPTVLTTQLEELRGKLQDGSLVICQLCAPTILGLCEETRLSDWRENRHVKRWIELLDAKQSEIRDLLTIESRVWMRCTWTLRQAVAQLLSTAAVRLTNRDELRSRVRGNLERMFAFVPLFCDVVTFCVMLLTTRITHLLNHAHNDSNQFNEDCLKECVQLGMKLSRSVETLASFTVSGVNRWAEAEKHVLRNLLPLALGKYLMKLAEPLQESL